MRRPIDLLAASLLIYHIATDGIIIHHAHGFSSSSSTSPVGRERSARMPRMPPSNGHPRRSSYHWHRTLHSQSSPSRAAATKAPKSESSRNDKNKNNRKKEATEREIDESMEYLARLMKDRLDAVRGSSGGGRTNDDSSNGDDEAASSDGGGRNEIAYRLAKGRFVDLACTLEGERLLENLFLHDPTTTATTAAGAATATTATATATGETPNGDGDTTVTDGVIKLAVASLQSLCVYGMQIGVKGSEEQQARIVRHLFRPGDDPNAQEEWTDDWTPEDVRKLKYHRDTSLGKRVLAKLLRKRTAQGAFDLLVDVGAWTRHEDTALLRSGFPARFLEEELETSREAEGNGHDPDALLGIRRDLRDFKVYTIDGASTADVDDGISVEVLDGNDEGGDGDGDGRQMRYWIHIADVDRWAPRGSRLLEVAERRSTSLYLPATTLCMFPPNMSSGVMSLEAWEDKHALSLGVELDSDGSIIPSSILVTPSLIHVDYRLTYDQVDEMLDEGVGYTEEWQIGALLAAATKRRAHRVAKGSTEGLVPTPIPKGMVTAKYDKESKDYDISVKIETTHNSGANMTIAGEDEEHYDPHCSPVSSSQLIVTEMMILAGEAIGKWHQSQPMRKGTDLEGCVQLPNELKLPYRRQRAPDFKSRETEASQMNFLFAMNKRYPHAWYARRFFNKVAVSENPGPHFGMGLDCYVQWSSPIRRITDLQVHSALKRYLRRKQVNMMLQKGLPIPSEVSSIDLGCDISKMGEAATTNVIKAIDPIDYTTGLGMIFAGRPIQSSSGNYWMFEYIRRRVDQSDGEVMFEGIVLGCVNKDKNQYAVYVYELGLEHRYVSEGGPLEEGRRLWLKVSFVNPRMELLTFSLASRSGGLHARRLSAPAA